MKYTAEQIRHFLELLERCKDVNGRYTHDAMCRIAELRSVAEQYLEVLENELHHRYEIKGVDNANNMLCR